METPTRLEASVLDETVIRIFLSMSGLQVRPAGAEGAEPSWAVTAALGLSGERRYCLALQMGEGLALKVASRMLQEQFGSWGPPVEDAVGEVANIMAGNLKPHVEAGMKLSMPTVVRGDRYSFATPRMVTENVGRYLCEGEPMRVFLSREA